MAYLKKLVKSKTFWLGASQIVLSLGSLIMGDMDFQAFLLGSSGVLTIIFRLITTEPISAKM